jgi:hypothetical protein
VADVAMPVAAAASFGHPRMGWTGLPLGIHAWGGRHGRRSRLPPRSTIDTTAWLPGEVWEGGTVHYASLGAARARGSCLGLHPLLPDGVGRWVAAWGPADMPNKGGCPTVPLV